MEDKAENRFWDKVSIPADVMTGCWLWTASKSGGGYGRFKISGRKVLAHRAAFEIVRGPIPEGLQLDHLCRVPSCVNPHHLEPVTCLENVRRGLSPGNTWNRGEKHGQSKLTDADVLQVRDLLATRVGRKRGSRLSNREIAEAYGVTDAAIRNIAAGRAWAWLGHDEARPL